MSYLDPKERVIDLELTAYGRYLLAIGKLEPVYYAFFDDDVLYNGLYANVTESQSTVEPRIQEDTPRFSTQVNYSSRELAVFSTAPNVINDLIIGSDIEDQEKIDKGLVKAQAQPDRTEVLQQPLGKSDTRTGYAPAWNAIFYKAPLSASVDYLTSSIGPIQNIPQLEVNLNYTINRVSANADPDLTSQMLLMGNEGFAGAPGDLPSENTVEFEDGSTIFLTEDALILKLEESNTFFAKDNFEIECFEVATVNGEEKLTPLNFYGDPEVYDNDFDNEEGFEPNTVEQYFTVQADEEINPATICPFITKDKTKNFFQSQIFICEESNPDDTVDIYDDEDDTKELCE